MAIAAGLPSPDPGPTAVLTSQPTATGASCPGEDLSHEPGLHVCDERQPLDLDEVPLPFIWIG